jgi:hypothetical protein
MLEQIEKELNKISRWPWRFAPDAQIIYSYKGIGVIMDTDEIRRLEDTEFIAQAPQRIAALITYVRAAEAWLKETHPGEQIARDQELESARKALGL